MPATLTRTTKHIRQDLHALDQRERTAREEAAGLYAKARGESRPLTDAEKARDGELKAQLGAITIDREALREEQANAEALSRLECDSARISVREAVDSDPKGGFPTLGHLCAAVRDAGENPAAHPSLRHLAAAGTGMTQGVTVEGGVLVPPAYSREIWDGARQMSDSLLQYCDVMPMDPGVQSVTIPAVDETSRANGSRWGGVRGYWRSELSALTESRPKFREMKLEPSELYVFAYISDKLLRNAPGMASSIIQRAAADEINFKIGDSILNGTGTGQPVGVIGHSSVVSVAKETGQASASIVKENIDKMWARCHAKWRANAVWLVNQDVEPALEQLSAVVGTGGVPVYLPAGGVADTPNARLKGRPVITCEYSPTLGTVGDIMLANLGSYAVALRGMVDQAQSMHLKFDYAQTAFRFMFEADGQPWLAAPITPFKGSNTLSPIVTLATRA